MPPFVKSVLAFMSTPAHFVFGNCLAIVWIADSIRKPTPITSCAWYLLTQVGKFGM